MDKILVVGGTGTIGTLLTAHLASKGYQISLLSRNTNPKSPYPTYQWDIGKGYIDPIALKDTDVIINLAGAGIVDRRWTTARKMELRSSRIDGNKLLVNYLERNNHRVRLFIGASAIGVYGNRGMDPLTEESPVGSSDFLVDLCREWETSHQLFKKLVTSVVTLRIGLVLAKSGGILPTIYSSIVGGIGVYFGSGAQYMPWIHVSDLCRLVNFIVSRPDSEGIYNVVGPSPVTNKTFFKEVVKLKGGLGWIFPVPEIILRLILGARAAAILQGANVLPAHAAEEGFTFTFNKLEDAIKDLMT